MFPNTQSRHQNTNKNTNNEHPIREYDTLYHHDNNVDDKIEVRPQPSKIPIAITKQWETMSQNPPHNKSKPRILTTSTIDKQLYPTTSTSTFTSTSSMGSTGSTGSTFPRSTSCIPAYITSRLNSPYAPDSKIRKRRLAHFIVYHNTKPISPQFLSQLHTSTEAEGEVEAELEPILEPTSVLYHPTIMNNNDNNNPDQDSQVVDSNMEISTTAVMHQHQRQSSSHQNQNQHHIYHTPYQNVSQGYEEEYSHDYSQSYPQELYRNYDIPPDGIFEGVKRKVMQQQQQQQLLQQQQLQQLQQQQRQKQQQSIVYAEPTCIDSIDLTSTIYFSETPQPSHYTNSTSHTDYTNHINYTTYTSYAKHIQPPQISQRKDSPAIPEVFIPEVSPNHLSTMPTLPIVPTLSTGLYTSIYPLSQSLLGKSPLPIHSSSSISRSQIDQIDQIGGDEDLMDSTHDSESFQTPSTSLSSSPTISETFFTNDMSSLTDLFDALHVVENYQWGDISLLGEFITNEYIRKEAISQVVYDKKYEFRITQKDAEVAHQLVHNSSTREIFGDACRMAAPMWRDLQTLNSGAWLNDEVINGYLWLLLERNKRTLQFEKKVIKAYHNILSQSYHHTPSQLQSQSQSQSQQHQHDTNASHSLITIPVQLKPKQTRLKIHIFSTQFLAKMIRPQGDFQYSYDGVRRWSQRQGVILSQMDKVLIPCHVNGNHWTLSCINYREKQVEFYDSLNGHDRGILDILLQYIKDEALTHEKRVMDTSDWKKIIDTNIPKQKNGYDCGVFVLKMCEHLSENKPLYDPITKQHRYTQDDITNFRKEIALSIRQIWVD